MLQALLEAELIQVGMFTIQLDRLLVEILLQLAWIHQLEDFCFHQKPQIVRQLLLLLIQIAFQLHHQAET